MSGGTRDRMVDAAIEALRRHGVEGMSFTDVLAASGAARGAIYHHFPGGKAQLVIEAATRNGVDVADSIATLPGGDVTQVVEGFLASIRPVLAASADGSGCAVAALTVGDEDDAARRREVAAEAFSSWSRALAGRLTGQLAAETATDLATTLITLLEGAHVLCRASGNLGPFDRVARTITALVEARYAIATER